MAWVFNPGQPPWPGCGEGFHDGADVKPFLLWAVVMRVRSLSAGRVSVWLHTAVLSAGPGQPPPPGGQEKVASVTDTREYQHRKKNLINYSFIAFLTIDHKAVAYSGDAHDHRRSITGRSASCVSSWWTRLEEKGFLSYNKPKALHWHVEARGGLLHCPLTVIVLRLLLKRLDVLLW